MVASERLLLADAERRSERVWHDDGLPELGFAVLWLLLGAVQFADDLPWWTTLLSVVALFGGLWIVNRAVVWAKRRLVDPYVGWVRPREYGLEFFRRYVFPSVLATTAIVLVAGVGHVAAPGWTILGDWWPPLILAAVLVLDAVRRRVPGPAGLALIPLAFAAVSAAGILAPENVAGWCLLALGVANILIGAWRLRRFLRAHRASVPA